MARKPDCRDCKYYEENVDSPWPVCHLNQFHFEDDYSLCGSFEPRHAGGRARSGGSGSTGSSGGSGSSGGCGGCGCLVVIALLVLGLFGGTLGTGLFAGGSESGAETDTPFVESQEPAGEASSGYLLPTDTEYITEEDLAGYTKEEVSLIRNEIFARHGCSFQNETIRTYFEGQSWYEPVPEINSSNFDPSVFNDFESRNLAAILAYERSMGWRS